MMHAFERCCGSTSDDDQHERQRLERAFRKLDTENAGAIRSRLLNQALLNRNGAVRSDELVELDQEQKRALLAKTNENKNGDEYINFDEFLRIAQRPMPANENLLERIEFRAADIVTPVRHRRQVYSYLKEYSCCPPPIFMLVISIAQVSVFIYYAAAEGLSPGWLHGCPGCSVKGSVGPLVYHPRLRHQVWRYITYMFIHAGLSHILGNVILQLILGIPLELVHKLWRVGPLYVAGILLGSLLQAIVDPNVSLVGASGGSYALLAAHLANVILNWNEMPFRWFRMLVIALFVGMDLASVIYRRFFVAECDQVSYMAHVGGAVAGLLLGLIILRNLLVLRWERALSIVCLLLALLIFATCVVLNIVFTPGDIATSRKHCPSLNNVR